MADKNYCPVCEEDPRIPSDMSHDEYIASGLNLTARMNYTLHFSASESLYDGPEFGNENAGPLYGSDQPESMILGPFPDYIELTYEYLRVGPDGEHIAAFDSERGVWVVGVDTEQRGIITVMKGHDPNGTVWSDITITIKE